MANIRQYGLVWKDTEAGIWTSMVDFLGRTRTAHAIEVVENQNDGIWEAKTEQGTSILRDLLVLGFDRTNPTVDRLGDMSVIIVVFDP